MNNVFTPTSIAIILIVLSFLYLFRKNIGNIIDKLANFFDKADDVKFTGGMSGITLAGTKNQPVHSSSTEEKSVKEDKSEIEEIKKEEDKTEKSNKDLFYETLEAFLSRNEEAIEKAYNSWTNSKKDPIEKLETEALYQRLRFVYLGDIKALTELERLTKTPDVAVLAHQYIGYGYESVNNYEKAFAEFTAASNIAVSKEEKTTAQINIARSLFMLDKKNEAYQCLVKHINETTEAGLLSDLYEALAKLYDLDKKYDMRAIALEKAIQYKPNDSALHFSAAYSYSQKNMNELSFIHYKIAHHFRPDEGGTANNFALQYEELQMPMKAVWMYKKSFEQNETLAGANLAYKYMRAGFKDEAKEILEKASSQANPHNNIAKALAELVDNEDKEAEKEKEVEKKAAEQQRFITNFAEKYFDNIAQKLSFEGKWIFETGEELLISNNAAVLEGFWEVKENKFKIILNKFNNAATLVKQEGLKRELTDTNRPVYYYQIGKGYAYLSDEGLKLHISIIEGKEFNIFKLKKIT